jgi:release factor glutamine methyltransferase
LAYTVSGQAVASWYQTSCQTAQNQGLDPKGADWLLRELAGVEPWQLRLVKSGDQPFQLHCSLEALETVWQKHLIERQPLQYLVGWAVWRRFQLQVSPAVLIPRPETELLIDLAREATVDHRNLCRGPWADLGTGSGAIALGLAETFPQATIYGIDCSQAAIALAQVNIETYGYTHNIQLYQGSWFEPLEKLKGQLRGMVSNPPYIPTADMDQLQPEVQCHEPHLALNGGSDGLEHLRHLVTVAPDYLCSGGIWLVEVMLGQAAQGQQLLEQREAYDHIKICQDFAGIDRFVLAHRR